MSQETKAPGTRSNRGLTQFACNRLWSFVHGGINMNLLQSSGNTVVRAMGDQKPQRFTVFLHDQEILDVLRVDGKVASVRVSFTDYFDGHGQPTTTTAERLNGLLDCLGEAGVIPRGVRVFRDLEHYTTYLGKGDDKIAVGEGLAQSVYIKADQYELLIIGNVNFFEEVSSDDI